MRAAAFQADMHCSLRSFPRKRESSASVHAAEASSLGPRFRGDERKRGRRSPNRKQAR